MLKRWYRTHIGGWTARVLQQGNAEFLVKAFDWRGEAMMGAKMGLKTLEEAEARADELVRFHHPHTCGAQCSRWLRSDEHADPEAADPHTAVPLGALLQSEPTCKA